MKEQIEQIEAVRKGLAKVEKPSTYQQSAISALNAAKDNLAWHLEAEGKAAEGTKGTEGTKAPAPAK